MVVKMSTLYLKGFIRDVKYNSCLNPTKYEIYDISDFDVNAAKAYGLINLGTSENNLAFSKWVSPKRTRTYPFARIYNTYHLNSKKVTIIPIIKDEGAGTQNNDRINFITFSWMNLLNIYIILAYYENAEKKTGTTDRITNQTLNAESVKNKLVEVSRYQASALHWNTNHFVEDFECIYLKAVESYEKIALEEEVAMHTSQDHLRKLEQFKTNHQFCLEAFKNVTIPASQAAALRESLTIHVLESLDESTKGVFTISNYLGGEYHLTADEIYWENDQLVIQESKNTIRKKFPSENDIKDGLFKLILFANLEQVTVRNNSDVKFIVRLKLTGNFNGTLFLPNEMDQISHFCMENRLTRPQQNTINLLNREASENEKLQIWITKYKYQQ